MSLKQYIKRGLQYIKSGTPTKKIIVNVTLIDNGLVLNGRKALITGGTSGIGYEIAKFYLHAGAQVLITGRNEERLEKACEQLKQESGKKCINYIIWDNTDIANFKDNLKKVITILGSLDILVNNAGIGGGDINTTSENEYNAVMDTNLKANFFLSREVAKYMIDNKIKGNILNIASSSSLRPANSAYILSKWGVKGLTEGLALSLIPHDIVVNGIAPGPTATPMLNKQKGDEITRNGSLIGRFVLPEEIANMAVILVSDLSRSIVGDIIYMTGGSGNVTTSDFNYNFTY